MSLRSWGWIQHLLAEMQAGNGQNCSGIFGKWMEHIGTWIKDDQGGICRKPQVIFILECFSDRCDSGGNPL
jgi:uncharacterized heparinase superfamily protein